MAAQDPAFAFLIDNRICICPNVVPCLLKHLPSSLSSVVSMSNYVCFLDFNLGTHP